MAPIASKYTLEASVFCGHKTKLRGRDPSSPALACSHQSPADPKILWIRRSIPLECLVRSVECRIRGSDGDGCKRFRSCKYRSGVVECLTNRLSTYSSSATRWVAGYAAGGTVGKRRLGSFLWSQLQNAHTPLLFRLQHAKQNRSLELS